jgi:hypothetical protein
VPGGRAEVTYQNHFVLAEGHGSELIGIAMELIGIAIGLPVGPSGKYCRTFLQSRT